MAVALRSSSSGACAALPTRPPAVGLRGAPVVACSSRPGSVSTFWQKKRCIGSRVSLAGDGRLAAAVWTGQGRASSSSRPVVAMAKAKPVIQFIRGINEQSVADVKLTRSRDGSNGVASFAFDQPSVFDSSRELGDITGIYMIDEEGVLSSVDVSAKFVNGKPSRIEARYVMRTLRDWDRFMRFMERYANENELGFVKS